MKRALLLVNFGTPAAPAWGPVARYLQQMLTDPRVLNIATPLRLLVGGILIPLTRAHRSASAYRSIWRPSGSPLRLETEALSAKVAEQLGDSFRVWYAMRLGQPSIGRVMAEIEAWQPEHLTVLPLYPQYASSTTGTAMQQVLEQAALWNRVPGLRLITDYADAPGLADAFVEPLQASDELHSSLQDADLVLFSFHGLPISQVEEGCTAGYREACPCAFSSAEPSFRPPGHCYRAGCYRTARAVAEKLHLPPERWKLSFQSRLGSGWLEPYSDVMVDEMAKNGVKKLLVFCPSFTANCLETLEEVGMELRDRFVDAGGEWLRLVPCPGSGEKWVQFICTLVKTPDEPILSQGAR